MNGPKRRRGNRREHVLDAALDLFIELGFAGTTVTEIERRAGLSPGSGAFYRHFTSKEDVLHEAVRREADRAQAVIKRGKADVPAPDGNRDLYTWLLATADWLREFDGLIRLALSEAERAPKVRQAISDALASDAPAMEWTELPEFVVAVTALAGHHILSIVQGHAFQHASHEEFVRQLTTMVAAVSSHPIAASAPSQHSAQPF